MAKTILILLLIVTVHPTSGQSILNKSISVSINAQPLEKALQLISNKGNFYFSYNSNIIPKSKIVSYSANNTPVKQILDAILEEKYSYLETNNYIILKLLPARLVIVTKQAVLQEKFYNVNGYVMEEQTDKRLIAVSVYEKRQLVSTITNNDGFFKIKLRSKYNRAALTISKEMYEDTTVEVSPKFNQELAITLTPAFKSFNVTTISPKNFSTDSSFSHLFVDPKLAPSVYISADTGKVETTRIAAFLLSTRQKIQSINLKNFFTSRPYQVSFIPGLSTHGRMSSQVVNHFSLNVLGGYTGGVKGIEVAGLFNINKKYVKYTQMAGLLNITGGRVDGVQVAGLHNNVLDSVTGIQVAGISNLAKGRLAGAQVTGIYNHVSNAVQGLQVAGISNFAKERVNGVQIAGIGNIANRNMNGVQIGGIFNYAKRLRGVQIGLINIADTSEGYSIGLLNLIFKGYHKLAFTSNEFTNVNIAFKTGNKKLYSMLAAGYNAVSKEKAYSFGYGIGTELSLNQHFSINPELSTHWVYLGNIFDLNLLTRLNVDFHFNVAKHFSIFAGPSLNSFYTTQKVAVPGYKFAVPKQGQNTFEVASQKGWIGWNAGISFF